MRQGWVILLLMLLMVWRVWSLDQQEDEIKTLEKTTIRVLLTEPINIQGNSCTLEWRGWRLIGFQSICNNSKLTTASAGDVFDLVVKLNKADGRDDKQMVVMEVVTAPSSGLTRVYAAILKMTWRLRLMMTSMLSRMLPGEEASLIAGIVLGNKSQLSDRFRQALIRSGTMHVVAASGYNVTVIAEVVMWLLLLFISRRKSAIIALVVVWIYVLISGTQPPIIRAGISGSLVILSWIVGKEVWVLFGYVLSGLLMVIISPWLLDSVSFQLSMAATAGVIWGTAAVQKMLQKTLGKLKRWPWLLSVWENWQTTLVATIAVAPLSWMYFGQVSGWGLMVNPIVLGMVPMLMYLGMAALFLGMFWFPIGQAVAWLLLPLAKLWIAIVMFAGQLPGGMLSLQVDWWWAGGWWLMWGGIAIYTLYGMPNS